MHPIVKEFIFSGEGLIKIVGKHYNKEQFLERTFYELVQIAVSNKENVDHQIFIDMDHALLSGHTDTNLYLLFISFSILYASNFSQFERARVIHSIGSSLSEENIPVAIKSYYLISIARWRFREGNTQESNRLLKEAVAMIDQKNPRFKTILTNFANIKSFQGKLKEIDKEDLGLIEGRNQLVEVSLINCIFTGNYKEGFTFIEEYTNQFDRNSEYIAQCKLSLLKILSGDYDENNYEGAIFKNYVRACKELKLGNIEEALKFYQLLPIDNWPNSIYLPFLQYFPLHVELSLKNKGKAHLLLLERQQIGIESYMDDFFLARLYLLELNMDGAYEAFARLIDNVNRFGAMNRLFFELQFAKEMTTANILLLTNGIRDIESLKSHLVKKNELKVLVPSEKGIKLLIGDSQIITQMKKLVKKFANLKEPVLITGETGTGKELVSRAIHEEGPHSKEPFMVLNCGALTETLLESELFGYEAGAFTGAQKEHKGVFEAVGKGTVFLDEFGDISPKMQVSLLRVLESNEIRLIGGTKTRHVECKIVIATNTDLQKAVEEKKFREDLYFRLNRFDIKLPPLRERIEDIPILISHFLKDANKTKEQQQTISKSLLDALVSYRWPGNIRELKNEIERLKILQPDKEILDLQDFDFTHLQDSSVSISQKKETVISSAISVTTYKKREIKSDRILDIVNRSSKIDQRHEYIIELFKEYKKLTRLQIIEIAEINPGTATKDLSTLCKSGVIKKCMPTKSANSHYFVLEE